MDTMQGPTNSRSGIVSTAVPVRVTVEGADEGESGGRLPVIRQAPRIVPDEPPSVQVPSSTTLNDVLDGNLPPGNHGGMSAFAPRGRSIAVPLTMANPLLAGSFTDTSPAGGVTIVLSGNWNTLPKGIPIVAPSGGVTTAPIGRRVTPMPGTWRLTFETAVAEKVRVLPTGVGFIPLGRGAAEDVNIVPAGSDITAPLHAVDAFIGAVG